jgi:hypothetical protein
MRTKIISAFPGTGKTYYYNKHKYTCLDSDSSEFSWIIDVQGNKIRNPNFPNNYIKHIKENIGRYKYIFVSTHKEVTEALLNSCIYFYLMIPSMSHKEIYIQRYSDRGSSAEFIDLIDTNWKKWIDDLLEYNHIDGVKVNYGVCTVEKEISHMECVEKGDKI